jgi:hypothetical protein
MGSDGGVTPPRSVSSVPVGSAPVDAPTIDTQVLEQPSEGLTVGVAGIASDVLAITAWRPPRP